MTTWNEMKDDPNAIKCLDHGFVRLVDIMGDDKSIADAARCSYGKGTKTVNDDRNLIRYLIRHEHTSPIEMVELKFHLKMPIAIMRQHVRHRTASLNEYSGRYSEMTDEFYIPEDWRFQHQSSDNKQGSGKTLSNKDIESCLDNFTSSYETTYENYTNSLELGLAKELSRFQLPVGNYTELYWKIDLKNFFHYIKLREDSHAQYEIRVYAEAMYNLIKERLPISCEAYEDYLSWKNTAKLSRMEMNLLRNILTLADGKCIFDELDDVNSEFGMSKREVDEFVNKFFVK